MSRKKGRRLIALQSPKKETFLFHPKERRKEGKGKKKVWRVVGGRAESANSREEWRKGVFA